MYAVHIFYYLVVVEIFNSHTLLKRFRSKGRGRAHLGQVTNLLQGQHRLTIIHTYLISLVNLLLTN